MGNVMKIIIIKTTLVENDSLQTWEQPCLSSTGTPLPELKQNNNTYYDLSVSVL